MNYEVYKKYVFQNLEKGKFGNITIIKNKDEDKLEYIMWDLNGVLRIYNREDDKIKKIFKNYDIYEIEKSLNEIDKHILQHNKHKSIDSIKEKENGFILYRCSLCKNIFKIIRDD